MFPEEAKKPSSKSLFFDFEATQDTTAQCTEGYLSIAAKFHAMIVSDASIVLSRGAACLGTFQIL